MKLTYAEFSKHLAEAARQAKKLAAGDLIPIIVHRTIGYDVLRFRKATATYVRCETDVQLVKETV